MTPNEKYAVFNDSLTNVAMAVVDMFINYNGMNHDVLDYLAEELGIEWEEDENDA